MRALTSRPWCEFNSAYWLGCRCDGCKAYAAEAQQRSRKRRAYRKYGAKYPQDRVSKDRAYETIVRAVQERGLSVAEVARICGVERHTLDRILSGKANQIMRETETKILTPFESVEKDEEIRSNADDTLLPIKKSRQIVYSLMAQGWTLDHQQEIMVKNLGIKAGFIGTISHTKHTMIRGDSAKHVQWLARAIGNKTGPSAVGATRMMHRGHFPLKHYNIKGDLIESTLSADQLRHVKSVP